MKSTSLWRERWAQNRPFTEACRRDVIRKTVEDSVSYQFLWGLHGGASGGLILRDWLLLACKHWLDLVGGLEPEESRP
jgi:hypothetical protein